MSVDTSGHELAALMKEGAVGIYTALHTGRFAVCVDFTHTPAAHVTPCFGARGAVLRVAEGGSGSVTHQPHGPNLWRFTNPAEVERLSHFCAEHGIELKPRMGIEQIRR
ncbi:MAG: hypothetical protein IT567_00545 [Alphaproteobacteria bacterium]|nr:hypothetical protein [Alphaproteobacteria bacterium]